MPISRHLPTAARRGLALVCIASLLAACGGGGSGGSAALPAPPPPPPSLAGISLLAGSAGGIGNLDGTGAAARFSGQVNVAVGADGTLYVADTGNLSIRKITPAGVVTTLAGGSNFSRPVALAVDSAGNVYVVDSSAIRKITPAGAVTTLAGQVQTRGARDGAGGDALFNAPQGVAVDGAGTVYVADTGNATVRKITPDGTVTTLAGAAGVFGVADGNGQAAHFYGPNGIAVDGMGGIYVSDLDGVSTYVRKLSAGGNVSTMAKVPTGYTLPLHFDSVVGVAADQGGNVYLDDEFSHKILKISKDGSVATLAGTAGFQLWGIAADGAGNVYACDSSAIRKITSAGVVTTVAGAVEEIATVNATGSAARFSHLTDIASDAKGTLIVTEGSLGNETPMHAVRAISPQGVVTTLAGTADKAGALDGPAAQALFNNPTGVATDSQGNIFVADSGNYTIRKIGADGVVSTVAGSAGKPGTDDGSGAAARFSRPVHLAVDSANNLYVADANHIRKITPGGTVSTLALSYAQDGVALFNIAGIALDRSGNLYVSDTINTYLLATSTIRKITPAGNVTTLAGTYHVIGNADGTGAAASFSNAAGIAVATDGNVYVADGNNHLIRRITPDGAVTTVAGQRGSVGIALGSLPGSLYLPGAMTLGPDGELYITSEHAVLKLRF